MNLTMWTTVLVGLTCSTVAASGGQADIQNMKQLMRFLSSTDPKVQGFIESSALKMGGTFALSIFGIDPSYEEFEAVIYNVSAEFLVLDRPAQLEIIQKVSTLVKKNDLAGRSVELGKLKEMMIAQATDSDPERTRLMKMAMQKFHLINETEEIIAFVLERNPTFGQMLRDTKSVVMVHFNGLSEDGKKLVSEAAEILAIGVQPNFPALDEDNIINPMPIVNKLHRKFQMAPDNVKLEVLKEMTWFAKPVLREIYKETLKEFRRSMGAAN